jgi:hypothetical protein
MVLKDFHPTQASIVDAETGQPIAAAQVRVGYGTVMAICVPSSNSTVSTNQGVAVFDTATGVPQDWKVSAEGYIPEAQYAWVENDDRQILSFHLYRLPTPAVTLIVPDGYRGWIAVAVKRTESWVQDGKIGERNFVYRLGKDGRAEITASPLLVRGQGPDPVKFKFIAKFENGTLIPVENPDDSPPPKAIYLRHYYYTGGKIEGFIGTLLEQQQTPCPCD